MYEVPPESPSEPPLRRSSEVAILLVLGMLTLAVFYGDVLALVIAAPLASIWYMKRDALDKALRYRAVLSRQPRTIADPVTWLIILAVLGLLFMVQR